MRKLGRAIALSFAPIAGAAAVIAVAVDEDGDPTLIAGECI